MSPIYYIPNNAKKHDLSLWQVVAKAALLKQSIEKAKVAEPPTRTDLRLREKGVHNFELHYFNALSHDREISGVQVASVLLQLPPVSISGNSGAISGGLFIRVAIEAVPPLTP